MLHPGWRVRAPSLLLLHLVACSTVKVQQVVARSADSYRFSEDSSGFRISADPYVERARLQESFGCDLLQRQVLPVLVVIENHSAEDGYVVLSDKTRLVMTPKESTDGPLAPGSDRVNDAAGNVNGLTAVTQAGILVTPLSVVFLPLILFAERHLKNETIIYKNLQDKQMLDKTLYPGGSEGGFLYFRIESDKDAARVLGVEVALRNVRTKEILPIVVTTRQGELPEKGHP